MRAVYIIRNKINNKIYVGQTKNPDQRWKRHKYDASRNKEHPLYHSMRKYGVDNFTFQIIETMNDYDQIDNLETALINFYKSYNRNFGYNLELGGYGQKIIGAETRAKQSVSQKKRYNADVAAVLRAAKGTPKAKQNASIAATGSKNARAKINEETVLLVRQLWETGQYTQVELSDKFNIPKTTINHIIKRYTWKHI